MIWRQVHRYYGPARELADRHYSRQKVGSPQFMPSGSCMVLYAEDRDQRAVWGTSWPKAEFTKHEWAGAWMCSIYRNEGFPRSHKLIRQAVAATRSFYGDPPPMGMVTFINEDLVRDKATPGWTFFLAGFRPVGRSAKRGFLAMQLAPDRFPAAQPAVGMNVGLL
jgi:hypothetical protein